VTFSADAGSVAGSTLGEGSTVADGALVATGLGSTAGVDELGDALAAGTATDLELAVEVA
jgi:hypothetical protein